MEKASRRGKDFHRFKDLSGQRFGKLIAKEFVLNTTKNGYQDYQWVCDCDCGGTINVRSFLLTNGKRDRCRNCRIKLNATLKVLPDHKALKNKLFSTYQRGAKNRNLAFELTFDDVVGLFSGDCYYCGSEPSVYKTDIPKFFGVEYKRNGIDRIDSSIGYIESNVVSCCDNCNTMKMALSPSLIAKSPIAIEIVAPSTHLN